MRRLIVTGAAALLAAAVAACGSSAPSSSGASANGPSGTLTISNEQGTLWNCSFNPFNPSNLGEGVTMGQVYEPLAFVDTLENGKAAPWLATSWAWSTGNKVLTFTIRQGVKFNDGTPMTAADVAFTFNLMKKYPTLDVNSVWSALPGVAQQGDDVAFTFKAPAVPYFYYFANQVPIVPEHVWSKISNPVTYADTDPVGTGAYMVQPCTSKNITYVANPHYWQSGEPKIAKVLYPAFTSNDPANTYLATGQAQWGSQFIPNIQPSTARSRRTTILVPAGRQRVADPEPDRGRAERRPRPAGDRLRDRQEQGRQIGEYGQEPPPTRTHVTPDVQRVAGHARRPVQHSGYDPAKAKQILERTATNRAATASSRTDGQQLSFRSSTSAATPTGSPPCR